MAILDSVSNRELHIWGELAIDLGAAAYYFSHVFNLDGSIALTFAEIGDLVGRVIVGAIVLGIILFSLLSWRGKPEPRDERDHHIASRARAMGYWTLCVCVVVVIWQVGAGTILSSVTQQHYAPADPMITIHLLFAALVIAGAIKSGTQLFFYRRGI